MLIELYLFLMHLLLFLWIFIIIDYTSTWTDCIINSLPDFILGLFVLLIYDIYYINA